MKWLALLVLVLVVSLGLGLLVYEDPGYVMFSVGEWTIETSVAVLLGAAVFAFVILYIGVRMLVGVWTAPRRLARWRRHHRAEKACVQLDKGTIALAEGHWRLAEKFFTRGADHSPAPIAHYLGAARAAQAQGAFDRRDNYLRLARSAEPIGELAVGLAQAELLLEQRRLEEALAGLMQMRQAAPDHPHVLRLLARVYLELHDWPQLQSLLPSLQKQKLLTPPELADLEEATYQQLLVQAARGSGDLQRTWGQLPGAQRHKESLLAQYAELLSERGEGAVAEPLLRAAINKNWGPRLVHLYGLLQGANPRDQLGYAEKWYKQGHASDPTLLLTLGRLCLRNNLPGPARRYLEAGTEHGTLETYQELGRLLESLNEKDAAMACYAKGMEVAAKEAMLPAPVAYGGRGEMVVRGGG